MKRLPIFLTMVGALFMMGYLMPEGSGYQMQWKGDQFEAIAQGSLLGIILGPIFGLIMLYMPRKAIKANPVKPVGILRRLGALYINMFVIMFTFMALIILPILLIEAIHTSEFQWSFYRDFSRSTDALVGSGSVFMIFGLIFYYYYRSLLANRATIGQYLMGYQIGNNGTPWARKSALKRIGWSILTLCIWPITTIMAFRMENKAFLFDKKTNSLPVRFRYIDT